MSRLTNSPSANYYGTSFRERMKQMSKLEQVIEEKKRKIQQKLEEDMKTSAPSKNSSGQSSSEAMASNSETDIFRAKIFGKRHLNIRKGTDAKKFKSEGQSSTPSPIVPLVSTSRDMFANDGSFLERFKKLQGLLPTTTQNATSSTPSLPTMVCTGPDSSPVETTTIKPNKPTIDKTSHSVPYTSTLSSSNKTTTSSSAEHYPFQPSSIFQPHNVPPPPPPGHPSLGVTTTTAAATTPPSSDYAASSSSNSNDSNSSTHSIPVVRSLPTAVSTYDNGKTSPKVVHPARPPPVQPRPKEEDDDDDKYDPTSPTEDISPVKIQQDPNFSPSESSRDSFEDDCSVPQDKHPEKVSDMLSQIRHDVKSPSSDESNPPSDKEKSNERADDTFQLMEQLAVIIAQCGAQMEKKILAENRNNPAYWFLYDTSCTLNRQMRQKIQDLRYCPGGRQDDMRRMDDENPSDAGQSESRSSRKKRQSRWGPQEEYAPLPCDLEAPQSDTAMGSSSSASNVPSAAPQMQPTSASSMTTTRPPVVTIRDFARRMVGSDALSDEQLQQIKEQRELNMMYELILAQKKAKEAAMISEALGMRTNPKYDYDSDEDTDGGTWEHKKRMLEMNATKEWAEHLTDMNKGKHFIGDFLPPDELEKFMETFNALKEGREPDLSDYKEFKLTCENIGYQMLQRLGWQEGEGLGSENQGIKNPVSKGVQPIEGGGFGVERPANLSRDDDEYEAFRKRMMLAYRFRPNPLNNPRRPYY